MGSWEGDVSRALFYMAIRYNGLALVDGNPADTSGNKILGDLAFLLSWNALDPADDFEMNHNNVVYEWQRNRNPFVDYPQLAQYVYGTLQDVPWFANLAVTDDLLSRVTLYPNPSRDQFRIDGIESGNVEIFGITGIKVLQSQFIENQAISFDLPAGIYLARISSDTKVKSFKLIVR